MAFGQNLISQATNLKKSYGSLHKGGFVDILLLLTEPSFQELNLV